MSYGRIQEECDKIGYYRNKKGRIIKSGVSYLTTNGGSKKIATPFIYHTVVSGFSGLVNHRIENSTLNALYKAHLEKRKVVNIIPFDSGTFDIEDTAQFQLVSIYNFVNKKMSHNVETINILIEDKDTFDVFSECYKRIMD